MAGDLYFYCCNCEEIEHVQCAEKIFKTAFNRIGNDDYAVGYCKENKAGPVTVEPALLSESPAATIHKKGISLNR